MSETLGLCPRLWKTHMRSHGFKLTLGLLGWDLYYKIGVDVPGFQVGSTTPQEKQQGLPGVTWCSPRASCLGPDTLGFLLPEAH